MTTSPLHDTHEYYSQYMSHMTEDFNLTFDKKLDRLIDEGNIRTSTVRKKEKDEVRCRHYSFLYKHLNTAHLGPILLIEYWLEISSIE